MKKYGLQLRIPPSQPSKQAAPARPQPPAFAFGGDDEDDVEREISRQASKSKSLQKIEEQHKKALEEDPSVFDYDGVYDEMKEKIAKPKIQDKTERKSKYIETLLAKAKEREREHEIVYERKLLQERSKEDHLFADKEKFVTSAYKKKLAEQAKWLEEERLRQLREEKEDVTKKKDMSEFYFGLNKNVAFGASQGDSSSKPTTTPKHKATEDDNSQETTTATITTKISHREKADVQHDTSNETPKDAHIGIQEGLLTGKTNEIKDDKSKVDEGSVSQTNVEQYKRSDDALTAARERFLARKRAREQL